MNLKVEGNLEEVNEIMGMIANNKKLNPKNVTLQSNEDKTGYILEMIFKEESIHSATKVISTNTK